MGIEILKYPLDFSGGSSTNRIEGEQLKLTILEDGKAVTIPRYAPFFVSSLKLTSSVKGDLVPDVDYKTLYLEEELSKKSTDFLCVGLYLDYVLELDEDVFITYQTVGYPYTSLTTSVAYLVEAVESDSRPVSWNHIINKPKKYRPEDHKHPIGDLYGFESVVRQLNELRDVLINKHLYETTSVFTGEDRERFIQIESLLGELINKTYNNNVILTGIHDILEETFVNSTIGERLHYLLDVEDVPTITKDDVYTIKLSGKHPDHTYTIESEMIPFNKTEGIMESNVYFTTHDIPDGRYLVTVYATDGSRRTIKSFININIQRT